MQTLNSSHVIKQLQDRSLWTLYYSVIIVTFSFFDSAGTVKVGRRRLILKAGKNKNFTVQSLWKPSLCAHFWEANTTQALCFPSQVLQVHHTPRSNWEYHQVLYNDTKIFTWGKYSGKIYAFIWHIFSAWDLRYLWRRIVYQKLIFSEHFAASFVRIKGTVSRSFRNNCDVVPEHTALHKKRHSSYHPVNIIWAKVSGVK